jgi:hypothetical protein
MNAQLGRRGFLRTAAAGGLVAGLGPWEVLRGITPADAAEMRLDPDAVRFRQGTEEIVRWIEDTPRERIVESAIEKLKEGLSYRDLMAGVFLAAIRNIKPRPVGFKFHAVMAVHSAHLLGQLAEMQDRLLPMFWALDNFKGSQARDVQEGDWTLTKVDEAHLPSPGQALAEFRQAMDEWDSDKADTATAALCRAAGAAEVMEAFWAVAVRDQRNIGHKPIFAMQCWRALQTIGWDHAEPVLRSLAYGLLDPSGNANREPLGPYRANLENAKRIRDDWTRGRVDKGATKTLLETLRSAEPEAASRKVVDLLNDGIAPEALWDAVTLCASEMLMQAPGIVALHAMTAANAQHYIWTQSGSNTTRKLALLQAAGWMPLYRTRLTNPASTLIDNLSAAPLEAKGDDAVRDVFTTIDSDRAQAAAKVIGYAEAGGDLEPLFREARRMVFFKGGDSHQYKFGAAAWEECLLSSDPAWRAPITAAMMFYIPGAGAAETSVTRQARERLSGRA